MILPFDEQIAEFNFNGKSLLNLDDNSPALKAVRKFAKEIGLV